MDHGRGTGNLIEKLKQLKKIKFMITVGGPILLVLLVVIVLFLAISSSISGIMPVVTTASMSGVNTIYDGTYLMDDLESNFELWDYITDDDENGKPDHNYSDELVEDNNFFQELRRQREIWQDEYYYYLRSGPHIRDVKTTTNDIDLVKIIVPTHYQGDVNLLSYGQEFDEENDNLVLDEDGTLLKDYQGEKNVFNRDTRDFFEQAKERIGSTITIYPFTRKLAGHMIGTKVTFTPIKYHDGHDPEYPNNRLTILSDWGYLSILLTENETDIKKFNHDPVRATSKFDEGMQKAYNICNNLDPENDYDIWKKENYCYDYDLLLDEFGLREDFDVEKLSDINLQHFLDVTNKNYIMAQIPPYYIDDNGNPINNLVDGEFYYAVSVSRFNDDSLYEDYLKKVYIPYLYIDCSHCNKSVDKESMTDAIYNEIIRLEAVYREVNGEDFDYSQYLSGGTGTISGVTYDCGSSVISISGAESYSNHNANDITTTLPNANIYPLMEGEVIEVVSNCKPTCPYKDAYAFTTGTSLSQLNPGCSCGSGWGNYVKIQSTYNGKKITAVYAHLASVNVKLHDPIKYDTILGVMGNTGVSTGTHLHIELNHQNSKYTKFPATKYFTPETVKGTVCKRNMDGVNNV